MDIQAEPPLPQRTLDLLASLSYRNDELQAFLDEACQSVLELLGDGMAAITLYKNDTKNVLSLKPDTEKCEKQMDTHGHLSTYVVNNGCCLKVEDAITTTEFGNIPEGYSSYMGLPLKLPDNSVVGTLCYFDKNKRIYNEVEQRGAELFAERISITIDNYQLYQRLKDHNVSLEQLIERRTSELLAARDELARKEKLAAVGRFASQITHEIRNPLATIRLALEYIIKQNDLASGTKKRAELACRETTRLEQLLSEVLLYAKPVQISLKPIELIKFAEDFILTYESLVESRHCQLQLTVNNDRDSSINVLADKNKLTQIILNLITNACDASPKDGTICWEIGQDDSMARIRISNRGEIIPPSKLHKITEAFVSGKPGGFGLGLAIVKSIVDEHGGQLEIRSDETSGTNVSIYLPLAR